MERAHDRLSGSGHCGVLQDGWVVLRERIVHDGVVYDATFGQDTRRAGSLGFRHSRGVDEIVPDDLGSRGATAMATGSTAAHTEWDWTSTRVEVGSVMTMVVHCGRAPNAASPCSTITSASSIRLTRARRTSWTAS